MNEKLKNQIMGRVYVAYFLRRYGYNAMNFVIFIASSVALYISVSWKNVFNNMPSPSEIDAYYNFFTSAVLNTELAVQLSLSAIALVLFFYVTSFVRKDNLKIVRQSL